MRTYSSIHTNPAGRSVLALALALAVAQLGAGCYGPDEKIDEKLIDTSSVEESEREADTLAEELEQSSLRAERDDVEADVEDFDAADADRGYLEGESDNNSTRAACSVGTPGTSSYCTDACPCDDEEGDCDGDVQCGAGLTCARDVGVMFGWPADYDVCLSQCVKSYPNAPAGSMDFCSEECPCDEGEGNCSNSDECAGDLRCAVDVGADFGFDAGTNVCVSLCSPYMSGNFNHCSPDCPCVEGDGNCQDDADCATGLTCIRDIGANYGFSATTNVCIDMTGLCYADVGAPAGGADYCSDACPCVEGAGDCDSDAQCAPGLTCVQDVGADYGYPASSDVCLDMNGVCPADIGIPVGAEGYCSEDCPCSANQGDCDNSAQCGPGLGCAFNTGDLFGYGDPDIDVCVSVYDDLLNGHVDHCSTDVPCDEGHGDCDSDSQCYPGMICVADVGASYGFPADRDVCEVSPTPIYVSFAGRVISDAGETLRGVRVTINGAATTTSFSGHFNLSVELAERYIINTELIGYVPGSQIHAGAAIGDMVITMTTAQTFAIDPSQPVAVVDDSGSQIDLPANALVDANGDPVTEPVTMQVHTFDVVGEGMIGNMAATDSTGAAVSLQSVGAISVDFFGDSGTQYQLGTGSTAQITVQVPPELTFTGSIPMWHYDMATGAWIEEGVGTVSGGVATATVSHFSAWNFDIKFEDPACTRVQVSTNIAAAGQSVQARVVLGGAFPTTRTVDLGSGKNVLYNLPPNTPIDIHVPAGALTPFVSTNTGAAWGGSGTPDFPYDECNSEVHLQGQIPGSITGFVRVDSGDSAAGVTITATQGGAPVDSTSADTANRYGLLLDAGTYDLSLTQPGFVSVAMADVAVIAGKSVYPTCVKLRAGDADGDNDVDGDDETLVTGLLGTAVGAGHAADFDGNLVIDTSDLEALQNNLGLTGPQTPNDASSSCFDNGVAEIEPNEDGTPSTGGGTTTGNDFLASGANGPYTSSVLISAEFSPFGDEDIFAITNNTGAARTVELETFNRNLGYGVACDYSVDTVLRVRDDTAASVAYNDDTVGYCSYINYTLPANSTRYVHVTEYGDNGGGAYYLDIRFID